MKNKKAIKWFENRIAVMPDSETKEMFCAAIFALEKQTADKCCETCKYEDLELEIYPCCDCIRAKDYYEPYTEEES